jgi:uncharacterized protein YoxC
MEVHTLITAGFFIGVAAVIAVLGLVFYCVVQLKSLVETVNEFCRNTDARLSPVLEETEKTLRSVRVITDDVGAITGNVREVTDAVCDVADNIRAIGNLIGDVREQVSLKALGVKAGIQTALALLLKNAGNRG